MPLKFDQSGEIDVTSDIVNEKGKNVGKVRGIDGCHGIGLLRISECLSAETLKIGSVNIKTCRPKWWPIEAPKDRKAL